MRVWLPGGHVGYAWVKVVTMKGIFSARLCDDDDDDGASRGIEIVRLKLVVAVAGGRCRESRSGTRSATTL